MATITQRNGTYKITVSCGYTSAGKQIRKHLTWTPDPGMTAKQIEKELHRQEQDFEQRCQGLEMGASIKFSAFCEQWFDEYVNTQVKETTRERYVRLIPRTNTALGHLRMDKITSRHVQQFINNLNEDGVNQKTGGKLAVKTIAHYLSFVSSIFDYAIHQGMLRDNPCKRVLLPKNEAPEKKIYTLEETQQLLTLLETAPLKYRAFFVLAIFSGFRRGELLGLEWKDIEFQDCIVNVRRTSLYSPAKGTFTDTPKTKNSIRSLKLPEQVFELLRAYRAEQNKERLLMGDRWVNNDRIFIQENGEPMNGGSPYEWLKIFCKKIGMNFYGVHSFRHLNATLLINSGANIRTVSSALGHSQVSTTMNIYAHSIAEEQAKASDAIANVLDFKSQKKA